MNRVSLGKTRRRAVKRVIFLFVFALVALAYVATPLTAFACGGNGGGGNDGGGNNGGGNNGGGNGGVAASDKQVIDDLKKGTGAGEELSDINGTSIKFTDLKKGQKFKVKFADGVSLDAEFVGGGKAIVNLPSGAQVICQPQPDGTAIVTAVNGNLPPATASSTKETLSLFQNGSSSDWQLFTLHHIPLDRSTIRKTGQNFLIKRIGDNTFMQAEYLGSGNVGHNLVLVTVPISKSKSKPITVPLSDL